MNRFCLLAMLVSCKAPSDPGYAELAAERERLLELREQVELVPANIEATLAQLEQEQTTLPNIMGTVTATTDAVLAAIQHCGGTVLRVAPPRLEQQPGVERQELTVTFNGLSLNVAVCALGRMSRGPDLLLAESLECTRPQAAVSCNLTIQSARLDNTTPVAEPPPLPEAASAGVRRLHAEVVELWRSTAPARALVARAAMARSQLNALQHLALQHRRRADLADLADAIAATGLEPGRFAYDGDTLTAHGTIPSEAARGQLMAIRSTEHVAVELGSLTVDRALAPVEVASLPVIPTAGRRKKRGSPTTHIQAVDAEAMWLYSALARGEESIVSTTVRGQLVTGRLNARSAREARKTLRATEPGLAIRALKNKSLRGRGPKVNIDITGGRTPQLFDLLGNLLGVSLVAPRDLPDVTVVINSAPADGVVKALTSLLDLRIDKRPGVWLLSPKATRMPRAAGPRIDFSAVGLSASQALTLLDALAPTNVAVACDTPVVDLWLKNVFHGDAARAVLVNAGLSWPEADATGCRQAIPAIEVQPVELLGLALSDSAGAALVRDVGGAIRLVDGASTLVDGTELAVTRLGLTVTPTAGESHTLNLRESWAAGAVEDLRGSRLAATLDRNGRKIALFEASNGDWQLVSEGFLGETGGRVTIEPGKVTVTPTESSPYILRLRRRLSR